MHGVTLQQLLCLDAVVSEGSFQAAAAKLHRTHPTICSAVKNLEVQLGFELLDRSGYRVVLTEAGESFHRRAREFLRELDQLRAFAAQVAQGEETEFRIALGDLCPVQGTLTLLREFFESVPRTQLHLDFEAVSGPSERLLAGDVDLIVHHIDKSDLRLEYIDLCSVELIPVVAPDFLPFAIHDAITPDQLKDYVQCVIRDTARQPAGAGPYVVPGARLMTVGDQLIKRESIVQGMAWGYMPAFLVADDLASGRLLSVSGRYLPRGRIELVAARRRDGLQGKVANRFWRYLEAAVSSGCFAQHSGMLHAPRNDVHILRLTRDGVQAVA